MVSAGASVFSGALTSIAAGSVSVLLTGFLTDASDADTKGDLTSLTDGTPAGRLPSLVTLCAKSTNVCCAELPSAVVVTSESAALGYLTLTIISLNSGVSRVSVDVFTAVSTP